MPEQNSQDANTDLCDAFSFRKRSLPFLTVYSTIGNQAFSRDGCNIHPGLSYNMANIRFWIVLERTSLKRKFNVVNIKSYGKGLVHLLLMYQVRKTVC